MKQQPEYILQKQVCEYLRYQHPHTLWMTDTIAAVRLTFPQQMRNKAVQKEMFKCPDLIIFKARGIYNGLFIELKTETPFKKDGTIKKSQNNHLYNQHKTIQSLNRCGYYATFAWNYEMATEIINNYMNLTNGTKLI